MSQQTSPAGNGRPPVQKPLTLVMPIKSAQHAALLRDQLVNKQDMLKGITTVLDELRTVHFARFVVLDGPSPQLAVITSYDDDFDDYIMSFTDKLGEVFDELLTFIEKPPSTPVKNHREEFLAYVRRQDLACVGSFYSAYPERRVSDIVPASSLAAVTQSQRATGTLSTMPDLDLDDIQGVILRGYRRMRHDRHLLLQIDEEQGFKAMLRELATEDDSGLFVTVASDWTDKPPAGEQPRHCVNIGLTYSGLKMLGVPCESLKTFPEDFRQGAVERAARVGDTAANDPKTWIKQLNADHCHHVHAVLSLYASSKGYLEDLTDKLRSRAARERAWSELYCQEAGALYDDEKRSGFVHFGYRDGLSQPTIDGISQAMPDSAPEPIRDPLGPLPPGDFLLGYPSQREGCYPVPEPVTLGRNGSFAAFRILEQDVAGFERFLDTASDGTRDGRELLAARLCGRWRNGVPLVMSPASDSLEVARRELNSFDFADEHPDPEGTRCPLGSHIRRANPRRQPGTPGGDAEKRRIIRRGLPYGPPYDPAHPDDDRERGLVGLFICVSLCDQFEFVMRMWMNDGAVAGGLGRTRDPLTGNNDGSDGKFTAPGTAPAHGTGVPRFVRTRGGLYCFLPSMSALRYLASLEPRVAAAAAAAPPTPSSTSARP